MKALVTGGGGFLGSAIVGQLLARGHAVRAFSRGAYPSLAAIGAETVSGDLTDVDAVSAAVAGCDVVFHVAAKAGMWGSYEEYARTNVEGTRNVLAACQAHGVPRLVHTSTPSVVHTGGHIEGGDERLPYARRHSSPYPATKAAAERMVLAANGPGLATVALRPHLVWGPGDNHLIPRILDRARRGRLRLIGDGTQRIDTTYVDDAARAHLLAAERLGVSSPVAGRVYFVSSGNPRPIADVVNRILAAAGLPPVTARVPLPVAYLAGAGAELVWRALRRRDDPPMTRFLARQLGTAHWFDISAARRDLGYEPQVGIEEGMDRLAAALRSAAAGGSEPS